MSDEDGPGMTVRALRNGVARALIEYEHKGFIRGLWMGAILNSIVWAALVFGPGVL